MDRYRTLRAGLALFVALALVSGACGPAGTGSVTPTATTAPTATVKPLSAAMLALVEDAKKEGELVMLTSVLTEKKQQDKIFEGFRTHYKLPGFKITITAGPQMPQMQARLSEEFKANRPASTDIFIGTENHYNTLSREGSLEKVGWVELGGFINEPKLLAPEGIGVELTTSIQGIQYNPQKVKNPPTSLADLLKPEYKGQIGTTAFGSGFITLGSPQLWGRDKAITYYTSFVKQIAGQMNCGEEERTISGEFPIFAMDCGGGRIELLKKQGAPIEHVIPSDAALTNRWYAGIPKHAVHKASAKLMIDYLLGPVSQAAMWEFDGHDSYNLPNSNTAKKIKEFEAKGTKFFHLTVQSAQADAAAGAPSIRTQILALLQGAAR